MKRCGFNKLLSLQGELRILMQTQGKVLFEGNGVGKLSLAEGMLACFLVLR